MNARWLPFVALGFLAACAAAAVLERAAAPIAWGLVGCFTFANLRIGAQLPWVPASRYAVLASVVLAAVAIVSSARNRTTGTATPSPIKWYASLYAFGSLYPSGSPIRRAASRLESSLDRI